MPDRPYSQWTLRELFSGVEVTLRELTAHCKDDLCRAYQQLHDRLRDKSSLQELTPTAIHALAERLAESQRFSTSVHSKLAGMLDAIDRFVQEEFAMREEEHSEL
jgi:hypothetical protein